LLSFLDHFEPHQDAQVLDPIHVITIEDITMEHRHDTVFVALNDVGAPVMIHTPCIGHLRPVLRPAAQLVG